MRTSIVCLTVSSVLLSVLPLSTGYSQYAEYQLPTDAAITGIALQSSVKGIITTSDSLLFLLQSDGEGTQEFRAINLFENLVTGESRSLAYPVWVNDSTSVVWRTRTPSSQPYSLWRSGDFGTTWQEVDRFGGLDAFAAMHVLSDTSVFVSTAVDNEGQIFLDGYSETGHHFFTRWFDPEWGGFPFTGDFVSLGGDSLLLTTLTVEDTLAYYTIESDPVFTKPETLRAVQPKIQGDTLSTASSWRFFTLAQDAPVLMAVGGRQTSEGWLYRSTDAGKSWQAVVPNQQGFSQVQFCGNETWWAFRQSDSGRAIWRSQDAGLTWQTYQEVGSEYNILAATPSGQFWLGGDSGRVAMGPVANQSVPDDSRISLPRQASLIGNYPNPFNSRTTILFFLPTRSTVTLDIVNAAGHHVRTLRQETPYNPGTHQVTWDGRNQDGTVVSSGVYFCQFSTQATGQVRKLMLIK